MVQTYKKKSSLKMGFTQYLPLQALVAGVRALVLT